MTYIYEWFSFPKNFSVICPNCRGECNASEIKVSEVYNGIKMEYNSGKISKDFKAELNCKNCGYRKEKVLNWKKDVYWKFEIKGKVLWAWNLEHSLAILEYIDSKERKQIGGKYSSSLLHIPEFFKLAKNREIVVKKIRKQTELHKKTGYNNV